MSNDIRESHMAFYENGDYEMCSCSIGDIHNVEDVPEASAEARLWLV